MLEGRREVIDRLREMQRRIRDAVVRAHAVGATALSQPSRVSTADTIYELDHVVEPVLIEYLDEWGHSRPLVVVAEGLEPENGRVFPAGRRESDATLRLILDPIDGTRGLMFDKRAGWSLAGAAENRGPATRLRDIEVAVMTELPTSKMARGDVLWAVRGGGTLGARESLDGNGDASSLRPRPSREPRLEHGFATVVDFFPGAKCVAGELMDYLAERLAGGRAGGPSPIFEDQYLSTGGQLYELTVGHDRFVADLRPLLQGAIAGLCAHPYDLCTALVAEEAGVRLSDGAGGAIDAPFDVTTPVAWVGYANARLQEAIAPLIARFLRERARTG